MKIIIKKTSAILCLCAVALSACACSNASEIIEKTDSVNTALTETTTSADTSLTEKADFGITENETTLQTEVTVPEVTEKDQLTVTLVDYGTIEETDDITTAREFVIAYVSANEKKEETDLGKFISNKYLKTYLENDVKAHIEGIDGDIRGRHKDISISVGKGAEKDGINYVKFNVDYGANMAKTRVYVGMRGGKVVNYYDPYHIDMHGNLWCSDITDLMHTKGGDSPYKFPNPWDDEGIAERLVKAQELCYNDGYEDFEDAWNSLGE